MNISLYSVTYLPTKNQVFIGIKSGYAEKILMLENKIKEQNKIRSNCKNYLKIFKNENQEVVQIEKYSNGKLDCIFQAHRVGDLCYFIPFFKDGSAYPTYTYVSKIPEGSIFCEYMVNGNQIVYEHYSNETETIEYYYINYVKNGKYPVLEEKKVIIYKDLFSIQIEEYNNWMEHNGL